MIASVLEVRRTLWSKLFYALGTSIIPGLMLFSESFSWAKWLPINPYAVEKIITLLSLGLCLYYWLAFLDNRPWIRINIDGILTRKYRFPFFALCHIPWDNLHYYNYAEVRDPDGGPWPCLILGVSHQPELKIPLADLNVSKEKILEHIRFYAKDRPIIELEAEL